ncbi:acetyltransferase SAS4-like domain-containing protein [Aspergillus stella-maris]|uniref:acetyltransferase SAS4-like domain-containing protein n=1 Tax=Aspergillus stella-maris TaxID=1810926 RepID=UPI003CCE40B6
MRQALIITATALSGLSIAATLYLNYKKQTIASGVVHSSQRGHISPSTLRNITSLPAAVFSEKYYAVYDYASVSTPLHTLPDLSPRELLTCLIRRNMSHFASSPQARLLKLRLPADADAETRRSFDPKYLKTLEFEEGDLVCNAYRVVLRSDEKIEFEFLLGMQGRLVVCVEVVGDEATFHNETVMWRGADEGAKMPLERGLLNWVHEYTAWWMLSSGTNCSASPMTSTAVMPVRTSLRASRRDTNPDPDRDSDASDEEKNTSSNTVQPPPPKRPRLNNNPLPSRRRKSSPDLLDTTIDSTPSSTAASTKLRRPRPLFAFSAHPHAHAHTTRSPPPGAGRGAANTPRARNLRLHHHDNPHSNAALYLNGGRESPDPLDTISPAPAPTPRSAPKPKPQPQSLSKPAPKSKNTNTNTPTSAAYRQRRVTQFFKAQSESEQEQEKEKEKTTSEPSKAKSQVPSPTVVATSNSNPRPARANAFPPTPPLPPPENPIPTPQSLSVPVSVHVPVETADRAKPEPEPEPEEKGKRRSLRSHDGGSRVKSDLALYFPNYNQLISLEPPKTELLSENTVIKLIDDLTEPPIPPETYSAPDAETPFGNPLVNLHNCEVIILPKPTPTIPSPPPQITNLRPISKPKTSTSKEEDTTNLDLLHESHFFKPHRRHERQEKQLRNIERDRAQHEKQQLDRLLEELKSQDWLRALGVGSTSGRSLSEAEKKAYEPKRDYFIREISAVLQKFKIWREEEKRRKSDKERLSLSFQTEGAPAEQQQQPQKQQRPRAKSIDRQTKDELRVQEEDEDTSDVDALAARQLLAEARSATSSLPNTNTTNNHKLKRPPKPKFSKHPSPPPSPPHALIPDPGPPKPFTSFFAKPHLREQAMSANRKGRTRLAFGHPVPELPEREFELPGDILTEEAVRDCKRRRRRVMRESVSSGSQPPQGKGKGK